MIYKIDGREYQNLLDYGIRNLVLYCDKVNELNVFPVPDGDTGTNMVRTLQNGYSAIHGLEGELSELSQKFAKAVVFGARGNSGVIVSQFFKGFSECFYDRTDIDCSAFVSALEQGVQSAYGAVSNPVEGTILTVLRESTESVRKEVEKAESSVKNINDVVSFFLEKAKISLDNTPNLLPILKSAGVVDSGGAGIIYLFEGMDKYLKDEPVDAPVTEAETVYVDYSRFDRNSTFEFGYCTEFLLQCLHSFEPLEEVSFREELQRLGDSVVTVTEDDKVKVHVHTKRPEEVLAFAHRFGEFLTLKIENMSVQHSEIARSVEICGNQTCGEFAVVAVTQDEVLKNLFLDMGADVVVWGDKTCQPSTEDFLKAYKKTGAKEIFVFPNSKNSNLAACQGGDLYSDGKVTVFETKSVAECYAALSMMDFEAEDKAELAEQIRQIIQNVYTVLITQAAKDTTFSGTPIARGDFLALAGSNLLGVAKERIAVAVRAMETVLRESERDTVTLFAGKTVPSEELDSVCAYVEKHYPMTDIDIISAESDSFDMLISFE